MASSTTNLKIMNIPYLRFKSGLSGAERQDVVRSLRRLGVVSLKATFPGDFHPQRTPVYTIVVVEGSDRAMVDSYIAETPYLEAVSQENHRDLSDLPPALSKVA